MSEVMKQSEIHTEKDFGKRSDTSSHYRIKSGGLKVQLMTVMHSDKATTKSEFLMCQVGYRHEFIVASLSGYERVKLFTLKNFIKWEYEGRDVPNVEMSFYDYINPTVFSETVERNFLSLSNR